MVTAKPAHRCHFNRRAAFQFSFFCHLVANALLIAMQNHPWPLWQFPPHAPTWRVKTLSNDSAHVGMCTTIIKLVQWASHRWFVPWGRTYRYTLNSGVEVSYHRPWSAAQNKWNITSLLPFPYDLLKAVYLEAAHKVLLAGLRDNALTPGILIHLTVICIIHKIFYLNDLYLQCFCRSGKVSVIYSYDGWTWTCHWLMGGKSKPECSRASHISFR